MARRIMFIGLALAMCLLFAVGKEAALLTWKMTGEASFVGIPLQQMFSIGDTVEYTFTFDTEVADSNPDAGIARYINAIAQASVTVGSYSASIRNLDIHVQNDLCLERRA